MGHKDDVMLAPFMFWRACKELRFSPTVDMFATTYYKHVERYYAPTMYPHAAGADAFAVNWQLERRPYTNSTWPLIGRVLRKIETDQVSVIVVALNWIWAPWFKLCKKLVRREIVIADPLFLDA